jgi:hypothetical protein
MKRPCTPSCGGAAACFDPGRGPWRAPDGTSRQLLRLDAGQFPAVVVQSVRFGWLATATSAELGKVPISKIWGRFRGLTLWSGKRCIYVIPMPKAGKEVDK